MQLNQCQESSQRSRTPAAYALRMAVLIVFTAFGSAGTAAAQCGEWSSLANSIYNGSVYAMTEWNGKLYVGGDFTKIGASGELTVNYIAKWDPVTQAWSALGTGMRGEVYALCVWNNALYAGGYFVEAGGTSAWGIAKWNGTTWSAVGGGTGGSIHTVHALTVWNNALYVGGYFTTAGGSTAKGIARWNGTSWSEVGGGVTGTTYPNVSTLLVWNNELYVGGAFTYTGTVFSLSVAKWNGTSWTALGAGGPSGEQVFCLAAFNGDLYAGGAFSGQILRRCGVGWCPVGTTSPNGNVASFLVFDEDGAGAAPAALFAGGNFTQVDGITVNRLARWDGNSWSPVCAGNMGGTVNSLYAFDDGTGLAMYAGGDFYYPCGSTAKRIAKRGPGVSPYIITGPTGQAVGAGDPVSFTVTMGGTAPIDYQWRKDGVPLADDDRISGSASATLTIDPASLGDAGDYEVVISNGCGLDIGGPAQLVVYAYHDFDHDGDVDLDDFTHFRTCYNGPNRVPAATGCADADVDQDNDVDLDDFTVFRGCFNGPNRPPACQ